MTSPYPFEATTSPDRSRGHRTWASRTAQPPTQDDAQRLHSVDPEALPRHPLQKCGSQGRTASTAGRNAYLIIASDTAAPMRTPRRLTQAYGIGALGDPGPMHLRSPHSLEAFQTATTAPPGSGAVKEDLAHARETSGIRPPAASCTTHLNTATIREQSQAKDRHAPTFPASCMCVDDSRGRDPGRATRGCRAAGSLEGSNCDRPRWRGVLGGPVRDRDRPESAGPRRQRRRCRRRHGGCPGRHGALQRGNRRWWLLRLLRRPLPTGPHHRRAGNRAERHASRLLHQPRDRAAFPLPRR